MEKSGLEVKGRGVSGDGAGGCREISEKCPGNILKITGWSGNSKWYCEEAK